MSQRLFLPTPLASDNNNDRRVLWVERAESLSFVSIEMLANREEMLAKHTNRVLWRRYGVGGLFGLRSMWPDHGPSLERSINDCTFLNRHDHIAMEQDVTMSSRERWGASPNPLL